VTRSWGGLLHNPHTRRSKPKMAALIFWRPFQDSCNVAMVKPPVSYLEPTVSATASQVSIGTAGCACLAISSTTVYLLHYLRRTATVMERKKATLDELEARAEANGY
jgi:hypothetical protein